MNNRGYYERLISDSPDRELTDVESAELENALERDPSLVQFQQELAWQVELARSLPHLSPTAALKLRREKAPVGGPLHYLWNERVSLPLPLAALLSLALVGFGLTGMLYEKFIWFPNCARRRKRSVTFRLKGSSRPMSF